MKRATYYDGLAGCYKIKGDVKVNNVQRLGKLEDIAETIESIRSAYNNKDLTDEEAWQMTEEALGDYELYSKAE